MATIVKVNQGGTGANLIATGGTSQVLKQVTVGGAVTVGQLSASDLSNGVSGTGAVLLASSLGAYLPLAGGTMVGNILATDNLYDLGASGATRFRTAYLGTSLMVPAINGGSAANDDITIQGTTNATRTTSYVNLQPSGGFTGIVTSAPQSNLDVGGLITTKSAGLDFADIRFSSNVNGEGGMELRNTNTGSAAGYRFAVSDQQNDAYLAFAMPSTANTTNLFGVSRATLASVFTNATTSQRHLALGTIGAKDIILGTTNAERVRILSGGNVGIGVTAPTAVLHLKAPTATASTGQIKLAVGTPPTTPEDGLLNYTSAKGLTFDVSTSTRSTVGLWAYVAKTATYTATAQDYTIDCTANTFTVTLPTSIGISGRVYIITNSGAGTITVGTTSSQTFTNVVATPTTLTMAAVGSVIVQSDGANWLQLK